MLFKQAVLCTLLSTFLLVNSQIPTNQCNCATVTADQSYCQYVCIERALSMLLEEQEMDDDGILDSEMGNTLQISKRGWGFFACKCCYRTGSSSCCNACAPTTPARRSTPVYFSPFPSDYTKRDINKRSLMMPRCCRRGNQACCRLAMYRRFSWNEKRSSDFDNPLEQPVEKRAYPRILCCRLGISSCCGYGASAQKRSNRASSIMQLSGNSLRQNESPVCKICAETGHPLMCGICDSL